jgi:hypothetical protein
MNHFLKKKNNLNPREFTNTVLSELTFFEGTNSMLDDTPMVEVLPLGGEMKSEVEAVEEAQEEVQPRRSTRTTRLPSRLHNYVTCKVSYLIQDYIFYDKLSSKHKSF